MELKIFERQGLGLIRTYLSESGEPHFLANDIANALGYTNPRKAIADHCDIEDVTKRDTPTKSGTQLMSYINESGLYSLVLSSKLPQAKEFKRWVTSEVLPSIRKDGGYLATSGNETPEEIMAKALVVAKATLERIDNERKLLQEQNQRLIHCSKLYTSTEIAKELGLKSAIALNNILADKKIQFKQNGTWILYSKYADKGYVSIKQEVLDSGKIIYDRKFTGLGREFVLSLFK